MLGEVFMQDAHFSCSYQPLLGGILNFPNYFNATAAFRSTNGSMSALAASIENMQALCADVTVLGSFTENHDVVRFAFGQPDVAVAANVIAYGMLGDGIPVVYEGQEQHYAAEGEGSDGNDPFNREALWLSGYNTSSELAVVVKKANGIRLWAGRRDGRYWTAHSRVLHTDAHNIVLSRGGGRGMRCWRCSQMAGVVLRRRRWWLEGQDMRRGRYCRMHSGAER